MTDIIYFTFATMYLVSKLVIISVAKISIVLQAVELNYFYS